MRSLIGLLFVVSLATAQTALAQDGPWVALEQQGKLDEAIKALDAVKTPSPELAQHLNRAKLLKAAKDLPDTTSEQYKEKRKVLKKLISQFDPARDRYLRDIAVQALQPLENRFGAEQENRLYVYQGYALLKARRYDEALACFNKVADKSPSVELPVEVLEQARQGRAAATVRKLRGAPLPEVLESQGNFGAAATQLQGAAPVITPDATAHLDNLKALLALKQSVPAYRKDQQLQSAVQAYGDLVKKLDPVRDAYLLTEASKDLASLQMEVRKAADSEAAKNIELGAKLRREHSFDDAVAAYARVIDQAAEVSEANVRAAREGRAAAQKEKAGEPTFGGTLVGILQELFKGLLKIIEYFIYLCLAVIVLMVARGAVRVWRGIQKPLDSIFLSFRDLTGTATDQTKANQALTQEVQLVFESSAEGGTGEGTVEVASDVDGSTMANVRLGVPVSELDAVVKAGLPVQIGPLTIDARDLFNFFVRLWQRPYKWTLNGSLLAAGALTKVAAQMLDQKSTPVEGQRWSAQAQGDHARAAAIQELVTGVIAKIAKDPVTKNPRSLGALLEGIRGLRDATGDPDRQNLLEGAQAAFERSVRFDPQNWVARFNLAMTLRKLGRNELAIEHLRMLGRHFAGEANRGRRLAALQRQPDFFFIVCYNEAVALYKLERYNEAEAIFNAILQRV
jgi:tetratricopeptide (TPR) repeat protein